MTESVKNLGGRPRKQADPGTTVSLGLRVPAELKAALDAAADQRGRNQSQEATRRIQASFEWQPMLDLVAAVEDMTGFKWTDDELTRDLTIIVVNSFLRAFDPERGAAGPFDTSAIKAWAQKVCEDIESEVRHG